MNTGIISHALKMNAEDPDDLFLDPAFWQALEKAQGYKGGVTGDFNGSGPMPYWKNLWMSFIDHLASGGTSEDFFKEL